MSWHDKIGVWLDCLIPIAVSVAMYRWRDRGRARIRSVDARHGRERHSGHDSDSSGRPVEIAAIKGGASLKRTFW